MRNLGPVSQVCADSVREFARQNGVTVWLDADDNYSALVDELCERYDAGTFDVPIVRFRGSYLETMLALEDKADGVDKVPLILHAPGLNQETVRQTPLLELYRGGRRYHHKLETLISEAAHERAKPEDVDKFVKRGDVSLEAADTWLANYSQGTSRLGPDLSVFSAQALFEELRPDGELAKIIDEPHVLDAIWERAGQLLGIARDWRPAEHQGQANTPVERASMLRAELSAFSMCVEFVDDLKRAPMDEWLKPLSALAAPFRRTARDLAAHIRHRWPDKYARWADEVEHSLALESDKATASDLGKIDTFRFEDVKILKAAISSLMAEDYATALSWASLRIDSRSFWTQRNASRRMAWQVIERAARLGDAAQRSSAVFERCKTLDAAGEAYSASGYLVDRHHRLLEQAWQNSPDLVRLDEFTLLRQAVEAMRKIYRYWLDAMCESFNVICESSGFLPGSSMQQRSIFREVVQPSAAEEPTAYFLVDGLRYEMGLQLADAMERSSKVTVQVKPRMAELPTITSVGMNVLAPVSVGDSLRPELNSKGAFKGFRSGTILVSTPESRTRAMHQAVGGDTCTSKSLEEINTMDMVNLKRSVSRSRLIVIHCEGIDKAGEKGVGLVVFERELQHIRSAWTRLHEAGIRRFVITADHGFLLHDSETRNPVRHVNQNTPKRRHVISELGASAKFETHVSSTALGYDIDRYFVFPRNGSPFDLGGRAKDFVHGGNSPQERIIPVITVQHRHQSGTDMAKYVFEAEVCPQDGNMHRVQIRLRQEGQVSLSYAGRKSVELILECADIGAGQVEIVDVVGGELTGATIVIPVEVACEVSFRIVSDQGKRVRVRIAHATGSQLNTPLVLPEWFDSEAAHPQQVDTANAPPTTLPANEVEEADWLSAFENEGVRRFFAHLSEYGSVNESEAIALLGNSREVRKFSRKLDSYLRSLPFRVVVETSNVGKCYVRSKEG